MKKAIHALLAASLISAPAAADVRPADCSPVLPVMDQAAQAPQQDVTSQAAQPAAPAKRRFLGLPFLLPLALGAGLLGLSGGGGGGGNTASPQ